MEVNKRSRTVIRSSVTRNLNKLQQALSKRPLDLVIVEAEWLLVQDRFEELKALDKVIFGQMSEAEVAAEEFEAEMEACDQYMEKYNLMQVTCVKLLSPFPVTVDETSTEEVDDVEDRGDDTTTTKRKFRLPVIEFKKFDGTIKEWLHFWGQFKKIDEDIRIDEHDKIEYLIQATVPGSRARRLVESFPAVAENYPKIIDSLKSRFGREDLQTEVYVRELLKLILVNATTREKLDIASLYDKIETQLRALDTLGVTSDNCAAILFPLIESCLSQELLRVWQRTSASVSISNSNAGSVQSLNVDCSVSSRLHGLLAFLRSEVENEQRTMLAAEGFGVVPANNISTVNEKQSAKGRETLFKGGSNLPTAAGLINQSMNRCVFCEGTHESENCFKAQGMSFEQKKQILTQKRACFKCLKTGHLARQCRVKLRCLICSRSHATLICSNLPANLKTGDEKKKAVIPIVKSPVSNNTNETLSSSNFTGSSVLLPTLKVNVETKDGLQTVRALIDSGSQKSYIVKAIAQRLGYRYKRKERVVHGLFGGSKVEQFHECYDVTLVGENRFNFEMLDQDVICHNVLSIGYGPAYEELCELGICVEDVNNYEPIELLLGADIAGAIYTGEKRVLSCGLVALGTVFGWTVMGKVNKVKPTFNATLSCLVRDLAISELWELDILGIKDPSEKKGREEMTEAAQQFFNETTEVDSEGRYVVRLPWIADHPSLPTNYEIAEKRLQFVCKKLEQKQLFETYNKVLEEWLQEGIIEELKDDEKQGHYLPHRAVVKEHSTTKVRPVFDASAHEENKASLNQCLEKGANLVKLIPSIILRFREDKIGVIADIRKAFLQISVCESDRNFLKFLWVDSQGNKRVFRHRRVVFGVSSSPFLLGATINLHLKNCLEKCDDQNYSRDTVERLDKSFYVDNCVTSVHDNNSLAKFIKEAKYVMNEAQFDLRGWESTGGQENSSTVVSVLGLKWFPDEDLLTVNTENVKDIEDNERKITKRFILSVTQRLFDPIGIICPVTLKPKLLLQTLWEKGVHWDDVVDDNTVKEFNQWLKELTLLQKVQIPRWIGLDTQRNETLNLHVFCDASKNAYSVVIYLRIVQGEQVIVNLIAAKSRVAPLKKLTIPRLELLAATIGARLCQSVLENWEGNKKCYYWSDSSTVLAWIKRKEEWTQFVTNRVNEIRQLTNVDNWNHVPGTQNPADLPSRGCSPKVLLESHWWEGPDWLKEEPLRYPQGEADDNEEEILCERKRKLVVSMLNEVKTDEFHLYYFSQYSKIIRMMAWIVRLIFNLRNHEQKRTGEISAEERDEAERFVLKSIQEEAFGGDKEKRISTLPVFKDEHGLIRIKTKICNREDSDEFRFPIVLPSKHTIIERLIYQVHKDSCHAGVQALMSILRERYWILGGRRAIKSVLDQCVVCRRFESKRFEAVVPPLPNDRVRDAMTYEITGVDLAGPLFLKDGGKAWICLFTCAIYRAVHLEVVTSLSTHHFIQALRRFVARRGRPRTIYSDNGTNFTGTENAFGKLKWSTILQYSTAQRIVWKFNPPSAAWWGGFWERLIGMLKQILRKVLGKARVSLEELNTLLCDCEAVMNARPLTYVSSDPKDLVPLTPAMFTRELVEEGVPDCDAIDRSSLNRRMKYLQMLRENLRNRFRNEYLGQLKTITDNISKRSVRIGEVVLIGNDCDKRIAWPLGRIIEIIPGKDQEVRLVRVATNKGQLLRPIQRLYPLEVVAKTVLSSAEEKSTEKHGLEDEVQPPVLELDKNPENEETVSDSAVVQSKSRAPEFKGTVTRFGRVTRMPRRFF